MKFSLFLLRTLILSAWKQSSLYGEVMNTKIKSLQNQTFLQRRHTGGQKAHEKMLNITNYQRNGKQNYNEVSPHTCQNGHHQRVYKQQITYKGIPIRITADLSAETLQARREWQDIFKVMKGKKLQ